MRYDFHLNALEHKMASARLYHMLAVGCLFLALSGCGDAKVDASTDEKMKESIAKVKAALPEDKRPAFEEALRVLAFADIHDLGDLAAVGKTGALERGIKERVNGKTGLEIIAEGQRVSADKEVRRKAREAEQEAERKRYEEERKAREREQALKEIDELRVKMEGEGSDLLSKFVVERASFGKSDEGFIRENAIELAVKNRTGKAVSRAYFRAILLTPGREIPWVDSEFNYQISGGVESGESAVWNLRPNMFGEWSKAPTDRRDVLFIVLPVALEGADGRTFASSRFDADDEKRLRALLDSVPFDGAADLKAKLDGRAQAFAEWKSQASAAAATAERDLLTKRKADAEAARTSLAKFVVGKSRFYFSKERFSSDPVIDLTIRNDTGQTVSRFYARGVLSSPGRETPWVDDTFNYSIRGGIKSGESQDLALAPNMFGEWSKAPRDRTDMVLTVSIERLDGADGKPLFTAEFSPEDEARLAALEKMIATHSWK